jgi:hypothetical protein
VLQLGVDLRERNNEWNPPTNQPTNNTGVRREWRSLEGSAKKKGWKAIPACLKRIRRPHIWGGWSQFGTNLQFPPAIPPVLAVNSQSPAKKSLKIAIFFVRKLGLPEKIPHFGSKNQEP